MEKKRSAARQLYVVLLAAFLILQSPLPALAEEAAPGSSLPQVLGRDNIAGLTLLHQIGKGEPHEILWSPDGETVALATGDGVHLFDGHSLQPLGILTSGYSLYPSFSTDSSLLAVCSSGNNQSIQLWDVKEQRLIREIKQDRRLSALHIDQQKDELLALGQKNIGYDKYGVALYKGYLDTYALKTGKRKSSAAFQSSNKQLMRLTLCPGGRTIFMTGIYDYAFLDYKGKPLYTGTLSFAMGSFGAANAGKAAFMTHLQPGVIRLIDLKTGKETGSIPLKGGVTGITLDETGEALQFYTSRGWQAHSLATGELLEQVPFSEYADISTRLSPQKDRVATLADDRLLLAGLDGGAVLGEQGGFLPRAWQAAVSGESLAAAKRSADNQKITVHLWHLSDGGATAGGVITLSGTDAPNLAFSPDSSRLALLPSGDSAVVFLHMPGGTKDREFELKGTSYDACMSADFNTMMAGFSGSVEVWPAGGNAPLMKAYMNSFINSVSLSADGHRAAACDGGMVTVWDVSGQERLLDISSNDLYTCALSPDGATVAAALRTKKGYSIKLYDVETAKVLWTCALGENFQELLFSPDGSLLAASGYEDGLVFINPEKGKRVFTLDHSTADFSFSPDGRLIVTTSSGGTLSVWGVP